MTDQAWTTKTGITSRADLIDLLEPSDLDVSAQRIEALGFQAVPQPIEDDELPPGVSTKRDSKRITSEASAEWTQFEPQATTYWRVVGYTKKERPSDEQLASDFAESQRSELRLPEEIIREAQMQMPPALPWQPLTSENDILTRLRKTAAANRSRMEMDLRRAVELLSRGQFLHRIPKRARKVWGHDLLVIKDRSRRLVPYWKDQDALCDCLRKIYPESGFQIARLQEGHGQLRLSWPDALCDTPLGLPQPGTLVLALTDLGALWRPQEDQDPFELWEQWGRILRDNGNQAVALIPCGCDRVPANLAALWHLVSWDSAQQTAPPATRERLLRLLSPCVRLEPELLRAVRGLLPDARRDVGLEASVWQDPLIDSPHSSSAPINPARRMELLKGFGSEEPEIREAALKQMHAARNEGHPAIWFEELISLDSKSQQLDFIRTQTEIAKQWITSLSRTADEETLQDYAGWIERYAVRLPELPHLDEEVRQALEQLYETVHRFTGDRVHHWQSPEVKWRGGEEQTYRIFQLGDQLQFETLDVGRIGNATSVGRIANPSYSSGSFLADIRSANARFHIHKARSPAEPALDDFWESGSRPSWVHQYGTDEFGLWCTFRVGEVEQRMRWVPAGTFLMGSPDTEKGRDEDEGPQHEVTISHGFWMFETPCTQALWEAVAGDRPSHFKGDLRPVEQVNWNDVQAFAEKLNTMLPGIGLRLPTEAEWEYSCRAGNPGARYGRLDAVAWHTGNSNSTTQHVGLKEANDWGLRDMLGNVYEWCQDSWYRRYRSEPITDPLLEEQGADRVVRGGGWGDSAQGVRAAYRSGRHPDGRLHFLGFRCLSSSEQSRPSRAAVSVSGLSRGGADETASSEPPRSGAPVFSEAQQLKLRDSSSVRIASVSTPLIHIESDVEVITVERLPAPTWAAATGRDRYGFWADLVVEGVQQRLRWIPPGSFTMGSPETEENRASLEFLPHKVTLTQCFWLFDTPCTQQLWTAVMKDNPSHFKGPSRPVEQVRWTDCQEFIQRLNTQFDSLQLRLPSEAQWEYACRAGTTAPRYGELDEIAWFDANSENETHDVKRKELNHWGLYDTLGNVWEWCQDQWHQSDRTRSEVDPLYETDEQVANRVIRGGSWNNSAQHVRAAYRDFRHPDDRDRNLGFRCLSSSEPSKAIEKTVSVSGLSRGGADETASSEPPRSGKKSGILERIRRRIARGDRKEH